MKHAFVPVLKTCSLCNVMCPLTCIRNFLTSTERKLTVFIGFFTSNYHYALFFKDFYTVLKKMPKIVNYKRLNE